MGAEQVTGRKSTAAGKSFAALLSGIKDDHIRSDARLVASLMQQAGGVDADRLRAAQDQPHAW